MNKYLIFRMGVYSAIPVIGVAYYYACGIYFFAKFGYKSYLISYAVVGAMFLIASTLLSYKDYIWHKNSLTIVEGDNGNTVAP